MDSGMEMILEREIRETWMDFILSLSKENQKTIFRSYSFKRFKEEVWEEVNDITNQHRPALIPK